MCTEIPIELRCKFCDGQGRVEVCRRSTAHTCCPCTKIEIDCDECRGTGRVKCDNCQSARATIRIEDVINVCPDCERELARAVEEVASEQEVSDAAIATLHRYRMSLTNLEEIGRRDLSIIAIDWIRGIEQLRAVQS